MTAPLPDRTSGLQVEPFRGWRFAAGIDLATVTSPPLDALADPAQQLDGLSPRHVLRLMEPALTSDDYSVARRVTRRLARWRADGTLVRDEQPAMYVYRRQATDQTLVGLVAAVSLHESEERIVLPHESVTEAAVRRQVQLLRAFSGQPEPVVTIHHASEEYRRLVREILHGEPLSRFCTDDGAEHSLWGVMDPGAVSQVQHQLTGTRLLLADGHHRYAAFREVLRREQAVRSRGPGVGPDDGAAPRLRPASRGLGMLVDVGDFGLRLRAIHRVLKGLKLATVGATPGLSARVVDAVQAEMFLQHDIDLLTPPRARCVVTDGDHWLAVEGDGAIDPAECPSPSLAVAHLHSCWLPRWAVTESDVGYTHDAAVAVARARAEGGAAVLLPPPPMDAVFDAAVRGQLLPAKATSFQPKPRIGLVMRHWPGGADDLR